MDYKYIKQLVERYFLCETTLQEEEILRAFFSQDNVPEQLRKYRPLFEYEQSEVKEDVLGDDFDERMMKLTAQIQPVKARTITMTQRLMPLFKAAAVVAIVLTLGNAMQMSLGTDNVNTAVQGTESFQTLQHGTSVAITDSATIDTLKQSRVEPEAMPEAPIIK